MLLTSVDGIAGDGICSGLEDNLLIRYDDRMQLLVMIGTPELQIL